MFVFLNSNPMSWASYNAATVIFVFNGIAYVTAVFGGWLADSFLGKFRTIVIFFCIYVAGFIFWPLFYLQPQVNAHEKHEAAWWCHVNSSNSISDSIVPLNKENCWWAVYLSIAIVGVGYGTVRVNIIPYGAFQVLQYLYLVRYNQFDLTLFNPNCKNCYSACKCRPKVQQRLLFGALIFYVRIQSWHQKFYKLIFGRNALLSWHYGFKQ